MNHVHVIRPSRRHETVWTPIVPRLC